MLLVVGDAGEIFLLLARDCVFEGFVESVDELVDHWWVNAEPERNVGAEHTRLYCLDVATDVRLALKQVPLVEAVERRLQNYAIIKYY